MTCGLRILQGGCGAPLLPLLVALLLVLPGCRQAKEGRPEEARPGPEQRAAPTQESVPAASPGARGEVAAPADTSAAAETTESAAEAPSPVTGTARARGAGQEAAGPGDVDWMKVDEANKKVSFDVVAGLTAENSAWNFNGYANGKMTILVPQGWTVTIRFTSRDADVPHSLYTIDEAPPYPAVMPDAPAIPKAYSINLKNGIGPGQKDTLRFTTAKAATFFMACGVPGHAASGMWDRFVVSATAPRPSVTFRGGGA